MENFIAESKRIIEEGILSQRKEFAKLLSERQVNIDDPTTSSFNSVKEILAEFNENIDLLYNEDFHEIFKTRNTYFQTNFIQYLKYVEQKAVICLKGSIPIPPSELNLFMQRCLFIGNLVDSHGVKIASEHYHNFINKKTELEELTIDLEATISSYDGALKNLRKGLDDATKLEKLSNQNSELGRELEELKQSSESAYQAIINEKSKVEELKNQIDLFFEGTFRPLQTKILDENNGLSPILNNAQGKNQLISESHKSATQLTKQIEEMKKGADEKINSIQTQVSEYESRIGKINKDVSTIEAILSKITDEETGIEANAKLVQEAKHKTDELYDKIQQNLKSSTTLTGEIEGFHKESKTKLDEIKLFRKEGSDVKQRINEILKIVSDEAQTVEFVGARSKYKAEKERHQKMIYLIVSIIIVLVIVVTFLPSLFNSFSSIEHILLRFLIPLPLVYLLIFHAREHNKASSSYDTYMFKTVISHTWLPQLKELLDNFDGDSLDDDRRNEIFDYTLNTLNKLYDEPYYDTRMQKKDALDQIRLKFGHPLVEDIETSKTI